MPNKPASININLVPKDPFFHTSLGRAMQWALSAGRYIVIFTELVVIISFAARFTLDRQITDLNSAIVEKESIIKSYGELEQNFRIAQSKIENIRQIEQEVNIVSVFEKLTEVTPSDVTMEQLTISPDRITATGRTLSQTSFNLLVNNLQLSPQFHNVSVNKVESEKEGAAGLVFSVTASTKETKAKANTNKNKDKVNVLDRTQGL